MFVSPLYWPIRLNALQSERYERHFCNYIFEVQFIERRIMYFG